MLAAISGQKTKLAGKTGKGQRRPYYYGIQPTGYPDQPFIPQLYYDGATTQILLNGLTRVPEPVVPLPPPPQTPNLPPVISGPSNSLTHLP